jgi:hypothetical protein
LRNLPRLVAALEITVAVVFADGDVPPQREKP